MSEKTDSTQEAEWFVRLLTGDAAPRRVFAFPHLGNGVGSFTPLAKSVRGLAEVWPVNLPGRQGRYKEAPRVDFDGLVHDLGEAIERQSDGRPYALLGYCSGALLAYGVLRELEARGCPAPDNFVAVAFEAPHLADVPDGSHLPSDEFWEALIRFGGVPEAVAVPEYRPLFEPTLRADFSLIRSYMHDGEGDERPTTRRVPITVVAGRNDPVLNVDDLLAWSQHTQGPFALQLVEGGHWLLDEAPEILGRLAARQPDQAPAAQI